MTLAANALVTLEEAKAWLDITGATEDSRLETEINRASEAIEGYCGRPLKAKDYTSIRLPVVESEKLYLKATPIDVSKTITVTLDGASQTIWKSETDGDPANFDVIVGSDDPVSTVGRKNHLWRSAGWSPGYCSGWWGGHPYRIVLTYTGGLNPVPEDLKGACLYIVQKLWRDRSRGIADVQTVTLPSGSITILDIAVPRWAQNALDRYKRLVMA
jgi:gp6-like head-tail connector protein